MTLQNINNNHSRSVAAMPLKDSTSDNANNFAMQRQEFRRTFLNNSPDKIAMINHKMWYGNSTNRFSSRVVESHKKRAVGVASLNPNGATFGMTTPHDYNYVDRSLIRVRRMGSAVPAKHPH